jgi:hypothetical protein
MNPRASSGFDNERKHVRMKPYSQYAHASISMSKDDMFQSTLNWLFEKNPVDLVVECGTYVGLGSTTSLAQAIINSKKPAPLFITMEADEIIYNEASLNLRRFPFIIPVWGLSVASEAAKDFLRNDEALLHPERYPDVFTDHMVDPVGNYINEIEGQLSKTLQVSTDYKLDVKRLLEGRRFQENVLGLIFDNINFTLPVFLLDSAGGIGYFEFQTVQRLMNGRPHFLILDDIHHVKHFRSYRDIADPKNGYIIINESMPNGWVIACYPGLDTPLT